MHRCGKNNLKQIATIRSLFRMFRIVSNCSDAFHRLSSGRRHARRMDKGEIDQWLEGFVTDLTVGNERVPLERVVAARLDGFVSLREQGLTWRALASLVARAGGRRKDGKLISGDQLRVVVSRHLSRRSALQAKSPAPVPRRRPGLKPVIRGASSGIGSRPNRPSPVLPAAVDDKDLSDNEIAAALARIKKV